jgi:hypothetical protein
MLYPWSRESACAQQGATGDAENKLHISRQPISILVHCVIMR